ncbi:hypothetical protein N9C44_00230 [bacterium]|jgi:hypothetical protein|nr:hypothetical protein [bacterium]
MTIIAKIVDKTGIFKKLDQKAETFCYALLWSSMFICLAQMF